MSISRRKPKSVKETEMALVKAKTKMDSVAPADQALTATTQSSVDSQNTSFLALIAAMVLALYNQIKSTNKKTKAQKAARMWVSHYFQAFFNGCDREDFEPESKVLYGLPENQNSVPPMTNEADLLFWGGKAATGDAARVAAGGAAMSNPTADSVTTKVGDFNTANNDQSNKKGIFSTSETNTTNALPAAIAVVTKVWDEVETFYDGLSKEAMRAKAREWGVVYESDIKVTITATLKNQTTGALLANVITTVIESGSQYTSDAAGITTIETSIAFGVTLESALDGYVTKTTNLEFQTGVTEYAITIELLSV